MAEEKQQNQKPKNAKRTRKWVWCAAIVIVIGAIICCLLWKAGLLKLQTVDEQLAAIEAARAIPDEENAAIIYNVLIQDPNATSLLDTRPGFLDDDSDNLTARQPWSGKEYPELAVWIKEQQHVFDRLLEASKFDKCRFPIAIDPVQRSQPSQPYRAMRQWTFLLRRAANNDIGEGRIDDAIDKWRCLLQMGNHLRQQPLFVEYLVAIAIEAVALNQTVLFLVEGNADETHLRKIETLPLHTEDDWTAVLEEVLPAEELAEQKLKEKLGLLERLKYEFGYGLFGSMKGPDLDRIREIYRRKLLTSRGLHILVALRRYKNKNDRWPESLDVIQSSLPAEILIDPYNNGPFVYKLTDDSFKLYSKGKNNIDEDGKYRRGPDDWPIWPPRGRKPKTKKENANEQ
ncbi:hypothetical protein ES703_44555 [subsurface metagenome]